MFASIDCGRLVAFSFLESTMAQFSTNAMKNVDKSPKRPEFRAFGDAVACPASSSTAARLKPAAASPEKQPRRARCRNGDQADAKGQSLHEGPGRPQPELS
jgi:hypothetical protein